MKVLVTGANGFVGTAVCRRLLAERWTVVAALRQTHAMPDGVETRIVEPLGPTTSWTKALHGIDAVVHLAGRAHVMRETEADPAAIFRAVNTAGTLHLAQQAAAHGVHRFVFMSSTKVNGDVTGEKPFTFEDAPAPLDAYGRSKWEAEQGLAHLAHGGGGHFHVTVFRPPLVYGPGVRGNFLSLLRTVKAGWPLPLGAIDNRRSLIFVDNLADAVATALREPAGQFETFLPSDGEDISTPDLIRRVGRLMGAPPRLLPVPTSWLLLAGGLLGRGAAVKRLTGSLQVRGTALRERFGWVPPTTLDQGLATTVDWFKAKYGI
ncbi:MAG TPA: NAD-dependent epimerase/dehydratase family protein [Magnetospirillaceae bacterium]|jgi:UDP-glucose 4-epimerase